MVRSSSDHDDRVQTQTNRQQREVSVDISNEENVNNGKPITHFQTTGTCKKPSSLVFSFFGR